MRLGIKLMLTNAGASEGSVYNHKETMDKRVTDIRSLLRKVFPAKEEMRDEGAADCLHFDGSSAIVYMLQLLGEEGYMITVIKAAPDQTGRPFDNTSIWVYFPKNIDISADETEEILLRMGQILTDKYSIDENEIARIASKEYGAKDVITIDKDTTDVSREVAVMEYGSSTAFTLEDLLGESVYQQVYAPYRAVFLVDKNLHLAYHYSGLVIDPGSFTPVITIAAPNETLGFKPYVKNVPFIKPLEAGKGTFVSVTWRRPDFEDIIKPLNTSGSPDAINSSLPTTAEMMITVKRRWIDVVDEKCHTVQEANLTINQREFEGRTMTIPYEEAQKGVVVTASKPGYETASKTFKDVKAGMRITLPKKMISHVYRIKAFDAYGNPIDDMVATIETSALMGPRPIRGYHLQAKTEMEAIKRLHFDKPKPKGRMYALFFGLGALSMGVVWCIASLLHNYEIGWSGMLPSFNEKVTYTDSRLVLVEDVTEAQEDLNLIDFDRNPTKMALDYLNTSDVWEKNKMAEYEYLDGLYDALNKFELDSLKMVWQSQLANCPKFSGIMTRVERNLRNHWKPADGKAGGQFDAETPGKINVDDYMQWLEEDHRSKR